MTHLAVEPGLMFLSTAISHLAAVSLTLDQTMPRGPFSSNVTSTCATPGTQSQLFAHQLMHNVKVRLHQLMQNTQADVLIGGFGGGAPRPAWSSGWRRPQASAGWLPARCPSLRRSMESSREGSDKTVEGQGKAVTRQWKVKERQSQGSGRSRKGSQK